MNRQERRQRLTLTIFFAGIVFLVLLLTVILSGVLLYLSTRVGLLVPDGELSATRSIMLMMLLSRHIK